MEAGANGEFPDVGVVHAGARERPTLLRSVGGAAGVRVDLRRMGPFTVASLQGEISERFDGAELGRRLTGQVLLDLAGVERITSFGVKQWLKMLQQIRADRVLLVRCSEPVVNQIRMIRSFCGRAELVSFFAPYACTACGTDFSALYDVLADRDLVDAASVAEVSCPRCGGETVFDDDPRSYLQVPANRLIEADEGLAGVLAQLQDLDGAPIRKVVAGDETWVTLSAPMDETLRVHRPLEGLEGVVVFDLSAVTVTSNDGVLRFLARINTLPEDVREVRLVGCPLPVLRGLLGGSRDPRVGIVSVKALASCSDRGIQRPVVVTLRAPAVEMALQRGASPPVPCDWCLGRLDFGDALADLRAALDLAPARRITPVPGRRRRPESSTTAPRLTPAGASRASPSVLPRTPDSLPPFNSRATPSLATVPRRTPVPVPMSEALLPDRNMSLLLGLAVVFVLLTLVGTLGLMGGIALMLSTSGSEAPPVAVEQVAAPEADGVPLGWADGLPPPWTDHRFVVRSDRVELVGGAKADSPDAGLELARLDMMAVLLERLQGLSPAGESLPKVPLEGQALTDAVVRFEAQTGGIGVPERTDGAVRHDEDGVFVVARYALPIDEWQRLGDIYRQRTYFRGVVLRPPPPAFGAATGAAAVVTDTASFMRAMRVGDGITAIEGQQVSSFAEAKEVLTKRWSRTDPGRWMSVQIVRDGRADEVEFRKPGVTPELR